MRPPVFKDQQPLFCLKIVQLRDHFSPQICILCKNIFDLMDWNFKFDDEIRNCFFNLFAFHFLNSSVYTRGIYAEGYTVFVFPFVCSFVCSFVRTSVPFMELLQSFTYKQLKYSISHQPLIRKHSYLDHRYPGGSAFIP